MAVGDPLVLGAPRLTRAALLVGATREQQRPAEARAPLASTPRPAAQVAVSREIPATETAPKPCASLRPLSYAIAQGPTCGQGSLQAKVRAGNQGPRGVVRT